VYSISEKRLLVNVVTGALSLVDENTPLVLLLAVHDVGEPAADESGVGASLAFDQGDLELVVFPADQTDGGDKEGGSSGEGLDETTILISVEDLLHGELALDDLEAVDVVLGGVGGGQTVSGDVQDTGASDTLENQVVLERGGDELLLALLGLPDNEEVAGTGFGDAGVVAEQPENLIVATSAGFTLSDERRTVVGTELGVTETTGPCTDGVLLAGKKLEALSLGDLLAKVGVDGRSSGQVARIRPVGEDSDDHVEQGLLRDLNAETGVCANESGTQVEEATLVGEPLGTVGSAELLDEDLELLGGEVGKGDTGSTSAQTFAIATDTEQTQLAVLSVVQLQTLKTFGCVVKNGSSRHDAQGTISLEFGSVPSIFQSPASGDHVVGAGTHLLEFLAASSWGISR